MVTVWAAVDAVGLPNKRELILVVGVVIEIAAPLTGILTLAAGSIACFGIEHLNHRPRPPALVVGDARKPPELWEILGATHGPWVQQLEGGRGLRRLTLNPDNRSAVLEEDYDGDGHIDREWEFSWRKR